MIERVDVIVLGMGPGRRTHRLRRAVPTGRPTEPGVWSWPGSLSPYRPQCRSAQCGT